MIAIALSVSFLMVTLFVPDVALQDTNDYDYEPLLNEIPELLPYIANNEVSSQSFIKSKGLLLLFS